MKLTLGLCALSLAAALASTTAFAAGATGNAAGDAAGTTATGTATGTTSANDTGMATLGVDISGAGDTATSVQSFNNSLNPEQQAQVTSGCAKVTANPNSYAANIQAFCKNRAAQ